MPADSAQPHGFPVGILIMLVIAAALYVAMLSTITFSTGPGDASFGQAIASLLATVGLWIALAVLLVIGAMIGEMPHWARFAAVFLVPFSGAAAFTAIDMCSRHIKWAIVFPVVLPVLIASYALWIRMPALRAIVSAEQMSAIVWALVLLLSGAALLIASVI